MLSPQIRLLGVRQAALEYYVYSWNKLHQAIVNLSVFHAIKPIFLYFRVRLLYKTVGLGDRYGKSHVR